MALHSCESDLANIGQSAEPVTSGENSELSFRDGTSDEGTLPPDGLDLPTVMEGILQFDDNDHLSDYFDFLSTLTQEQEDGLEQQLGYQSLRSQYIALEEENFDYADNLAIFIRNPFLNGVLNRHHELIVADTFYRFMTSGIIAKAPYRDIDVHETRMVEGGIFLPGIRTYEYGSGDEIIASTRGNDKPCDFQLMPIENLNNPNSGFYYVKIVAFDNDGAAVQGCSVNFTVDWGDGTIETITSYNLGDAFTHNYDIPAPNTFLNATVSVTINSAVICNTCDPDGSGLTGELNSLFYTSAGPGCRGGESRSREVADFEYNDGENRVVFKQGYSFNQSALGKPNAWAELIHFKRTNSGNWTRARPGEDLELNIYGTWFLDDCSATAASDEPNVVPLREKEKRIVHRAVRNGDDLFVRSDEELFVDFNVYSNSATVPFPTMPGVSYYW